ncbi:MAG TPA: glycosyltransferase [Caulobacteraceae bacterium]|jgi:glycosyltransferase involved in cell wall biosynthesis
MTAQVFIPPARPARVLLVLGSLDGGGAERVAVNLIHRCDPGLVDIRLGLLRPSGAYLASVEPHRLVGPRRRGKGLIDAARAPGDIAEMIARTRPDVVMSFGMAVNAAVALALPRGAGRPRWICREDSNTAAEIANFTSSRAARALVAMLTRQVHRTADCLLAVSRDLGARLAADTPGAPVRVIHNPIDLSEIAILARVPLAEPPARPFVIAAGRLVRQKGFDILIEAFAKARYADGMDLVILGEGPLLAPLKARAAALGIAERVKFPGFQANPWAWFSRAALFVLASRWEGFGNVVAEAMACGVPVVVSDCDFGPREQVGHAVSGWIAPAGSPAALGEAIDTVLADPDLAANLAAWGVERARAFDIERIVAAYARLFLDQAFAAAGADFALSPAADFAEAA